MNSLGSRRGCRTVPAPSSQNQEERGLANQSPKGLKRHRPAVVDRDVEQVLIRAGVPDLHGPESAVGRDARPLLGALLCGGPALVLVPQPVRVGGEALVQPDVPPPLQVQVVPETSLVGEFVQDHELSVGPVVEVAPAVHRAGYWFSSAA